MNIYGANMNRNHIIALTILGIVLISVGWCLQLNGVRFKVCSNLITIYDRFGGEARTSNVTTVAKVATPLNITNIDIEPNTIKSFGFAVKSTINLATIRLLGTPSEPSYRGIIRIVTEDGTRLWNASFTSADSFERNRISMGWIYEYVIPPGNYMLELYLNTSAHIDLLQIQGISSEEIQIPPLTLTVTPSSSRTYSIDYICGVDFTYMVIATVLMSLGILAMVISLVLALRFVPKPSPKPVTSVGKSAKKRK